MQIRVLAAVAAIVLTAGCATRPAAPPVPLRGFGPLAVTTRELAPDGQSSWVAFRASDPEYARRCASKFLADYTRWGLVRRETDPALPGTVLRLPDAGWWCLGLMQNEFHVLFARDREGLAALCRRAGAKGWAAVPADAYPPWLDCFDNASTGFWFLGGGTLPKDVNADFNWLADNQYEFCAVGTDEARSVAPGLVDRSILDWYATLANRNRIPYRMVLEWRQPERPLFVWNRVPLPHVEPAPGQVPYPDFNYQRNAVYNGFEPIPASDAYTLDARRRIAALAGADPYFMGHHGCAETPDAGVLLLAAVAGMPSVKTAWHDYLRQQLGLDLAGIGQRYRNDAKAFAAWDDVSVPLPADFVGRRGPHLELDDAWLGKADPANEGQAAGWFKPGWPRNGWGQVRSQDPMLMSYALKKPGVYWLRRTLTVNAAQAAELRFLHLGEGAWHKTSGDCDVYLNGDKLEDLTLRHPLYNDIDQCFALGKSLRPGENQLVIATRHLPLTGYTTLSATGRWVYPSPDAALNRLYYDAVAFSVSLRVRAIENNLIATRAGDPDRPIKLMAPWHFLDEVLPLCQRYGAYPHDTGQGGACWAPWMTRYALPLGIPASAEPGGPATSAASIRQMITFYLMLGNSAVDLVFHPTNYLDRPDVKDWLAANRTLIACIGKMDMLPPRVGVLRSLRNDRLHSQPLWSTDAGRGPLQAVGRTFNYLTLKDFASGQANAFPIVMDTATEILTEADIAAIAAYVERGGTFVAMHNTGMHTEDRAFAWPISRLTGLRVCDNRGHGGTLRFEADEDLWPSMRDRAIQDWGLALDWLGKDNLGASIACEPIAADVRVVARWTAPDGMAGKIAVAERRLGKGRVVTLGSGFWRKTADRSGRYEDADDSTRLYLDELLAALGAPRESWVKAAKGEEIFVEHWRSKNGLYDLFPVARITTKADEPEIAATAQWQYERPLAQLWEVSSAGAAALPCRQEAGRLTLADIPLLPMQSRVYAAPRADLAQAALYWFEVQRRQWPALAAPPPERIPAPIAPTADVLALTDGWQLSTDSQADTAWTTAATPTGTWRPVRLGSFAALGLPEDAIASFRRDVELPAAWRGQRVRLVFDCQHWFWGINQRAQLWLDGQPLATPKKLESQQNGCFSLDLTDRLKEGRLGLALRVDGRLNRPTDKRPRPAGVTGIFYLQAEPQPLATQSLDQNLTAMLAPDQPGQAVRAGQPATCAYLETRFRLPDGWQTGRIYLTTPATLGFLVLNDREVLVPDWMAGLDISGLLDRTGDNVLRWLPAGGFPRTAAPVKLAAIPPLALNLLPPAAKP